MSPNLIFTHVVAGLEDPSFNSRQSWKELEVVILVWQQKLSLNTGISITYRRFVLLLEEIWKADHQAHPGILWCCCSAAVRTHRDIKGCKEVGQVKSFFLFFWLHTELCVSDHTAMADWWCNEGGCCWKCLPASLVGAELSGHARMLQRSPSVCLAPASGVQCQPCLAGAVCREADIVNWKLKGNGWGQGPNKSLVWDVGI